MITKKIKDEDDAPAEVEGTPNEDEYEYNGKLAVNKITLQYGQILVSIESNDETTESICNAAMTCIHRLMGVKDIPSPEVEVDKKSIDDDADLSSLREYEKLMEGLKT